MLTCLLTGAETSAAFTRFPSDRERKLSFRINLRKHGLICLKTETYHVVYPCFHRLGSAFIYFYLSGRKVAYVLLVKFRAIKEL